MLPMLSLMCTACSHTGLPGMLGIIGDMSDGSVLDMPAMNFSCVENLATVAVQNKRRTSPAAVSVLVIKMRV